jgi:hypothetical protein
MRTAWLAFFLCAATLAARGKESLSPGEARNKKLRDPAQAVVNAYERYHAASTTPEETRRQLDRELDLLLAARKQGDRESAEQYGRVIALLGSYGREKQQRENLWALLQGVLQTYKQTRETSPDCPPDLAPLIARADAILKRPKQPPGDTSPPKTEGGQTSPPAKSADEGAVPTPAPKTKAAPGKREPSEPAEK